MGTAGGGVAAAGPFYRSGKVGSRWRDWRNETRLQAVAAPLEGPAHGKAVCALPVRPSLL